MAIVLAVALTMIAVVAMMMWNADVALGTIDNLVLCSEAWAKYFVLLRKKMKMTGHATWYVRVLLFLQLHLLF